MLCRCSRLAEGVRVRVGKPTRVHDFEALQAAVGRQPWHAFFARGGPMPRLRVSCERSRLYHSDAVAERVEGALRRALAPAHDAGAGDLLHVRLSHDQLQLSVDAVGEPLHRRGYRTHVGQAPLRETLAAACLRAAGYRGRRALWDPFCGSGTLLCEGLLSARGVAPGGARRFAFERWPALAGEERQPELDTAAVSAPAFGSDRDQRVLHAARANRDRAGLEGACAFLAAEPRDVAERIPRGALVVCNPPYGHRLPGRDLAATYRQFTALLARRPDLEAWVLTSAGQLLRGAGLSWEPALRFKNRGLRVCLWRLQR
jgi:putative N6-adenine-specific DNA methylase